MTHETIRRILVVAAPLAGAALSVALGNPELSWAVTATAGAVTGMIAAIAISASYSCVSYACSDAR
jgi:hypothetical protein